LYGIAYVLFIKDPEIIFIFRNIILMYDTFAYKIV